MMKKLLFEFFKNELLQYLKPRREIYKIIHVKKGKSRGFRTYNEKHIRVDDFPTLEANRILNNTKP